MIYTLLAALQLLAKQNKNSLGLFYLLFTNLKMCSWIKNSFMTKLYEKELIILINASTQLFFSIKHMKCSLWERLLYFHFPELLRNYSYIYSDTCIWQMGRHFPW